MGIAHRDPLVPGETTRSVDRPASASRLGYQHSATSSTT